MNSAWLFSVRLALTTEYSSYYVLLVLSPFTTAAPRPTLSCALLCGCVLSISVQLSVSAFASADFLNMRPSVRSFPLLACGGLRNTLSYPIPASPM